MKMLTMMMMMFVQAAPAEDVARPTEDPKLWELTLVSPERMIDMPRKYFSYDSCIEHGIHTLTHRETTREVLLGFVCEQEYVDEPTG